MALLEGTRHRPPLLARDKETLEAQRGQGQEILQMHRKLAPIPAPPACGEGASEWMSALS